MSNPFDDNNSKDPDAPVGDSWFAKHPAIATGLLAGIGVVLLEMASYANRMKKGK